MLAGLEEQVKAKAQEIGKTEGVEVNFAFLGQADFATVRGAVRSGSPEKSTTSQNPKLTSVNEAIGVVQSLHCIIRDGVTSMESHQVQESDYKKSINNVLAPDGFLDRLKKII